MEQTHTHGELLVKARQGDKAAWDALVDRMSPLVWSVVKRFRLGHATASDVAQTVWLRLLEKADRIEDPERLPGWLSTTARREAIAASKRGKRELASDFDFDIEDWSDPLDDVVTRKDEHRRVREAFEELRADDRMILSLSVIDGELSYADISRIVGRPVGSLGPTRARALHRLRSRLESAAVTVSS